jgi:hypothetical protein
MFAANMPTVVMSVEDLSYFVYLGREPYVVSECGVVDRPQYCGGAGWRGRVHARRYQKDLCG